MSLRQQLKVLVVGASVAGPTAAYWLARTGASVTVIERFPSLRTGGQNIDIRTAGVSVMRKMAGMEASVRAKTAAVDGISFVRADGRPYGILRATGNPDQQSLVSEYEIYRGDLARILVDLSEEVAGRVRYVYGEQIASMRQGRMEEKKEEEEEGEEDDGGPVTVEFANGLPTAEYDLVVACDGANSRTRAMALRCGVRDHITPTNCWAAYFSIKQDLLAGSKIGQAYTAPGGRFLAVGSDPSGVSRATLMGIQPRGSNRDATLPFREAMKAGSAGDDEALKRFIARHYADVGWDKTPAVMAGMMETDDFYANEIVQVKLPRLSAGRVVLVGDAGYAPGITGTGTTLALTGAYILAGEIGKHRGDVAAGLRAYEERMRPIVTEMQKSPAFILNCVAPQTAWGIWLRNWIFAFVVWTRILEFAQRFFAGAFANSSEYPLPEYDWVE